MRLSKSKVMRGLQCHRQLWWQLHDKGAPELVPDAALQAVFDQRDTAVLVELLGVLVGFGDGVGEA